MATDTIRMDSRLRGNDSLTTHREFQQESLRTTHAIRHSSTLRHSREGGNPVARFESPMLHNRHSGMPDHRPGGNPDFSIKAVDEKLRQQGDAPTIGILLCKHKDKLVAEYALSDIQKPMGVSEYQLTQSLPENLQSDLPSIEEIENELGGEG